MYKYGLFIFFEYVYFLCIYFYLFVGVELMLLVI